MRRFAPRAEASKQAVLTLLEPALIGATRVLELASGTGQQIAHFASATPDIEWWPSERERTWLDSIAAWTRGLANVREPMRIVVGEDPLPAGPFDVILALNLLHLIDTEVTVAVFAGALTSLAGGGALVTSCPIGDGVASTRPAVPGWGVTICPPSLADLERAATGFNLEANDPVLEVSDAHRLLRWRLRR